MHQVTPPPSKKSWLVGFIRICKSPHLRQLRLTLCHRGGVFREFTGGEKVVKLIQRPPSWPKHRFMRAPRGEGIRMPFNHRMPTQLPTARFNPVMFGHYPLWGGEPSQLNWATMLWSSQISWTVCPWMDSGPIRSYCHNCLPDGICIEQRLKSTSQYQPVGALSKETENT